MINIVEEDNDSLNGEENITIIPTITPKTTPQPQVTEELPNENNGDIVSYEELTT